MSFRFFGFDLEATKRNKPDGEWDWDPPNLRNVYRAAERAYIDGGIWRPRDNSHQALWDLFKPHLLQLRPGLGDPVERNQPFIDSLFLLEAFYSAAQPMPLRDSTPREEVERLFADLPEYLQASIHGVEIETGDVQSQIFRKMVRVGLSIISSTEVIPGPLRFRGLPADIGDDPTRMIATEYGAYVGPLGEMLTSELRSRREFDSQAAAASRLVQETRLAFLALQKMREVGTFPMEAPGED